MKTTTTKLIVVKKNPKVMLVKIEETVYFIMYLKINLEGIIVESLVFTFMYQFNTCYLISYVD